MRRMLVVGVALAALVLADVAARAWAEAKMADRVAAYYPPAASVSASFDSFPFLGRLLVAGEVPGVSVDMEDVGYDVLSLDRFTMDLEDVRLDRSRLFRGEVEVLDVGAGRLEGLVDGASLARALGLDLRFGAGEVEVHKTVGGVAVSARATVALEGNRLRIVPTSVQGARLPASSLAVTFDIPGVELLPCEADVAVVPEGVLASCSVDDVPAALVRAAAGGAPGGASRSRR